MLHALCVIALAVLFSGGTVRHCRIFVKFSGFVVIVVCHVGSISSAPSAQQHAGLRAVSKRHGMVWCGAESSIKPAVSRPRGPVLADRHPSRHRASRSGREIHIAAGLALSTLARWRGFIGMPSMLLRKSRNMEDEKPDLRPRNLFGRNDVLLTRTRVLNS
jgi:hypothetical protein